MLALPEKNKNLRINIDIDWNPLNYYKLMMSEIQTTMIKDEKKLELDYTYNIILPKQYILNHHHQSTNYTDSIKHHATKEITVTKRIDMDPTLIEFLCWGLSS